MLEIDGNHLSIMDVVAVARDQVPVCISSKGREAIENGRRKLLNALNGERPIYGVNTGYGIFADKRIERSEILQLNRNLILSHSVGCGPALPPEVVRAAMLIRANTLAKGYSGVRFELVQVIVDMLNSAVIPVVPSQGSLGSSGDLCLLSQLALVFSRGGTDSDNESGQAIFRGVVMRGDEAMKAARIKRVVLEEKEGLAINNGATFTAAMAALAVWDAKQLLLASDLSLGLSMEALLASTDAFDERIHKVRNQTGQCQIAKQIRQLTRNSSFLGSTNKVQDAYSIRCAPQVHGAALDTLLFVENIVGKELNAATDNPLIFGEGEILSGGNFHGEPLGMVMDYLTIAMAEIGAIAERRIFRLTDEKLNGGLPPMLVDKNDSAGVNSGVMMLHYTAASLVLENQSLAASDSVHSLPTSGEQEDHNANATLAARHAIQMLINLKRILAIEIFVAVRAIDIRQRQMPSAKLGDGTSRVYSMVHDVVDYRAEDSYWNEDVEKIEKLISTKEFQMTFNDII